MIAVFQSESEALAFNAAVCQAMCWPDAQTLRYGVPVKHQAADLWAVPVTEYAAPYAPASATLVEALPADWFPPYVMP